MPFLPVAERLTVIVEPADADLPIVIVLPFVKLPESPSEVVYVAFVTSLQLRVTVIVSVKEPLAGESETLPSGSGAPL